MKYQIETRTLPHIFARAAAQTTQVIYPDHKISAVLREKISVEGENPSALLQNWINAVIQAFHTRRMAFSLFDVRQLGPKGDGWYLQVEVSGILLEPSTTPESADATCIQAEIFGDDQSCRAEFTLETQAIAAILPTLKQS
jgi:SHS2 domain-containing protein